MAYKGFVGSGTIGHFQSTTALQNLYPADMYAGRMATVEVVAGSAAHYYSNGISWQPNAMLATDSAGKTVGIAGVDGQALLANAIREAYSGCATASGFLGTMTSPGYDGKTYQSIRVAEAPFYAVRLKIRNNESTSYTLNGAAVSASSTPYSTGTTVNPNPTGGTWAAVTFNGSSSVVIPATLGTNRPSITYSDWIYISSVARADGTAYTQPYLYMRGYNATGPKSGLIGTTTNPNTGGRSLLSVTSAINRGRLHITSAATGDFATTNQTGMTDDSGTFSSFVYEFECLHAVPSLPVLAIGDSIMQGDGASVVGTGYAFRACADVSTPAKPVILSNNGWSNMTTDNFVTRLQDLFTAGERPSVVIFPCWTPNDGAPTQALIDRAWANAMRILTLCRQYGAIPVMVGPTPRGYSGANETSRQQLVARFRAFGTSGLNVLYKLDADGILASTPGGNAIAASFSSDSIHPNDAGNDALNAGLNGYTGLGSILSNIATSYFR
jgi:hypothetical protein